MLTKAEIIQTAKAQLALDFNCQPSDLASDHNTLVDNRLRVGRRIYGTDGCFLKILVFSGRAVISADPAIMPWCAENLLQRDAAWLFEYPNLSMIDRKLNAFGHAIVDIHPYYLPDPNRPGPDPALPVKWYECEAIASFEGDSRFGEAFCFDPNHPDVLAVAALDGDQIMGMAGASADSATMWQIGIDVLPEYRGRGIGAQLVTLLKQEVLRRGFVPFYGTVESHFHSQNIAINAGFFPAWAELYTHAIPA